MSDLQHTATLEPGTQEQTMILNMGTQHPSTHGVLRLVLEVEGETVVRMMPDIGYLHTGIEKTYEAKFYLVAMLFILFDVEAVFMYPWAVVYRELKMFGFWEMLIYIAILLVGFWYVWKKGVLDWSKTHRGEI